MRPGNAQTGRQVFRWVAGALVAGVVGLGGWLPQARAATVEGLYDVEVPVSGQDARERDRALRAGLLQVVVRVTGQRRVPPTGVLSSALQNPSRYVQDFGYGSAPDSGERPGAGGGQRLWVRFKPSATNDLLHQAGLKVWGRARPTVAVWVAVADAQGSRLIAGGEPSAAVAALQARATARGVPVVVPGADPQERAGVRAEEIAAERFDGAVQASKRLRADAVLIGRVRERVSGIWESRWTLLASEGTERFLVDGELLETVVAEGFDRAVDLLADRVARVTAGPSRPLPELKVGGVGSFAEYARVRRHLEGVETVSAVRVERLGPGGVTFRVEAAADRETLSLAIAQGGRLVPSPAGGGSWAFQLAP